MFKPGFQNPPYDGNDGAMPDRVYAPPTVTTIITASKDWRDDVGSDINAAANAIINQNSGTLYSFFNGMRHMAAFTGSTFWAKEIHLPQLRARYSHNSGHDHIVLDVMPENIYGENVTYPNGIDLDVDGYIAYVIAQPNYPDAIGPKGNTTNSICGPYSFYLNGTLLNTKPYNVSGPCEIYLCAFGTTALRSSSLQDIPIENSPFAHNKQYPLIQLDAPFGGSVPTLIGPDGSTRIPKHPDAIGNWWNNWVNVRNQAAWVKGAAPGGYGLWSFPNTKIYQGIQFKDARKSPLMWKGQNFATMYPDPNQSFQEVLWYGCIYGEFYNRLKVRGAKKSWLYGPFPGPTIGVNDKPMFFAAGGQGTNGGGALQVNMGFDLSPTKNPQQSDDNCFVPWGQGPAVGSNGNGIAQKQLDEMSAYDDAVKILNAAYVSSVIPEVTSLEAALATAETAIDTFLVANFVGTVNVSQTNPIPFGSITLPGTIFRTLVGHFTRTGGGITEYNYLTGVSDAISQQIYAAVNKKLDYPAKPFGYGSGPTAVQNYRSISVSGSDFTFGDWQGV